MQLILWYRSICTVLYSSYRNVCKLGKTYILGQEELRAGKDEYICEGRTGRVLLLARLDDWNYFYPAPAVHNCTAIYLLYTAAKKEPLDTHLFSLVMVSF